MKSIKVWVIDKLAIKITKERGVVIVNKKVETERRNAETRLMWMPGKRPVKVPMSTPTASAKISSINI